MNGRGTTPLTQSRVGTPAPARPRSSRTRRLIGGFAVVVALAGWGISYSTQVEVVRQHRFDLVQAVEFPACTEAAALAVMLLLVAGEIRPGMWTRLAWAVVMGCLVVTTWLNWLAAPGDIVGAVAHSWTPLLSVVIFLFLVHARPDERAPVHAPAPVRKAPAQAPVRKAAPGRTIRDRLEEALRLNPALRHASPAEHARAAGVAVNGNMRSERQRLLAELSAEGAA